MIVEGERTVPSLSIQLTVLLNIHIHIHTSVSPRRLRLYNSQPVYRD